MSVKKIQIRNLLSYKSIDVELGEHINIIVGKNGSGKSNFVNALMFVLTDKFQFHDRKMLENNIMQDQGQPLQVQLVLDNRNKKIPYNQDEVTITRQFSSKDEFFVGGKPATLSQVTNLLSCVNLSRSNYYNIVRQGKIVKISQMQDHQLFELLEEVSGVRLYEEKKAEALKNIELCNQEREEIVKLLNELSVQIKQLQDEKETFDQLKEIQKTIQIHEIQLAQLSENNFKHQLVDLNTEQSRLSNHLQKLLSKNDDFKNDNFKLEKQLESTEQAMLQSSQLINALRKQVDTSHQKKQQFLIKSAELKQKLKALASNDPQNLKKLKDRDQELDLKIKQLQMDLSKMDGEIQFLQILQTQDPVKRLKEEITALEEQLESYQKEFDVIELKIKQGSKDLARLQSAKNSGLSQDQLELRFKQVKQKMADKEKELNEQQQVSIIFARTKTQLQQKLYKLKTDLEVEANQLDKQVKDVFSQSLFKIQEFAAQNNLQVYGVFAQLMSVKNDRLLPLIETASGPRIFSLIVNDAETAKQIIDFNREQQGCVLRIYSLDLIEDKTTKYDIPKDAIDLTQQIQLEGNFPKKDALKQRILGKWVVVKDYQMALDVAQRYALNCITMDNEVVYSDSFITRVGATKVQQSKSALLRKILDVHREIQELESKDQQIQMQIDQDQDKELRMQRDLQEAKNELNQILDQLKSFDVSQVQKKKQEIQGLEELAQQLDIPIQQIRAKIKDIQQQLKNPNKLRKGLTAEGLERLTALFRQKQEAGQAMNDLMQQRKDIRVDLTKRPEKDNKQVQQIEEELQQLELQLGGLQKQSDSLHVELNEAQKREQNNKSLVEELDKQKRTLKGQMDELNLEIDQIKNQQVELENQSRQCQTKIESLEKERKMVDVFALDEMEQISKNQIIKRIKELKARFNHKFTQKDQSLFEKLTDIETKFQEYQSKLNNLKESQQEFDQLCQMMDRKADTLLQDQLFKKFADYFRYYFLKIAPSGECQVRLIKGLKKNKKNWGIHFLVSFKDKELQSWTSFSSGEKTIIAFVIMISLQRCDPAPFYILDEFDAALDDNYRQQVASVILELSRQSQYLIVTFRQELLQLNHEDIRYFKVVHHNQQSSIVKTTQAEAKKIIKL